MIKKFWVILILSLGLSFQIQAQKASVKTDSAQYEIGDYVNLKLSLQTGPQYNVYFPIIDDSLSFEREFIALSRIDTVKTKGSSQLTLNRTYTFMIFKPGDYHIPELPFLLQIPGDSNFTTIFSEPFSFTVIAPEVDEGQDIKDIKSIWKIPYTFQEIFPYFAIFIGLIILIAIILLIRYFRKKKMVDGEFSFKPKYVVPPHVEAFQRLEKLRLSQKWQTGLVKEYYTELTDILRVYIERQMHIPAVEMTSDELIDAVNSSPIEEHKDILLKILNSVLITADLVKFAKSNPLPDEHDRCFREVKQFVELTQPKEEVKS